MNRKDDAVTQAADDASPRATPRILQDQQCNKLETQADPGTLALILQILQTLQTAGREKTCER
jgi:hypothetical protein